MAQIFISYAREDFQHATELYQKLARHGFSPWMDKLDLLPGRKWRPAIERAIQSADFFLLLLSRNSIKKRGFVQREIRAALDLWKEKLEEDIYLIPVMLEALEWAEVPDEINEFQWVEFYAADGWEQLVRALEFEAARRGIKLTSPTTAPPPRSTVLDTPQPKLLSRRKLLFFVFSAMLVSLAMPTFYKMLNKQAPQSSTPIATPAVESNTASTPIATPAVESNTVFTENLPNGVRLDMMRVPAGSFLMGSPANEKGRDKVEGPRHRVNVPAFAIGKYEITQAQWKAVMGSNNNPSSFKGDDLPVENVLEKGASEFCQMLSKMVSKNYRLPTEAEWEYAARAGKTTPFAFGASLSSKQANFDGNYPYGGAKKGVYRKRTTRVGSFLPNAFGLYDMHGNVWEWCEDVYHKSYDGAPTDGSAWSSGGDSRYQVIRGGSWHNSAGNCRSAARGIKNVRGRNGDVGFRVVVSARTQ